jgi:hypothetical protein
LFQIFIARVSCEKNLALKYKATLTSPIITGTSTNGPITAVKASPELMPNTAIATAIASSKLLLAAVNERVKVFTLYLKVGQMVTAHSLVLTGIRRY